MNIFLLFPLSILTFAQLGFASEPLSGVCDISCLYLDQIYDGGHRNGINCLDLNNTSVDFPYCEGEAWNGNRFNFRACIDECRAPFPTNETCSKPLKNIRFTRGCEAARRFKQGLPYNFEYADGYYVEFKPEWISHPEQIPTLAQIRSRPLSDPCDISCVYLNQKYDGGFRNGINCLNLNNTSFEFPYCEGKPAFGARFNMRSCIKECRAPFPTNETCARPLKSIRFIRGCMAARAFKRGEPYNFEVRPGEFVLVYPINYVNTTTSMPTETPTSLPTTAMPTTGSPTTFVPTKSPTVSFFQNETTSPTKYPTTTVPTAYPPVGEKDPEGSGGSKSVAPTTSGGRVEGGRGLDTGSIIAIVIATIALLFFVVFVVYRSRLVAK